MKRIFTALSILLISLCTTSVAYAGSLNQYESEVVSAARGQFEYNGAEYKLDSSYISELIGYLSADDVDLTRDQRDTVLQSMNGYIETGVKEGYLVPVNGQDNKKDTNTGTDKNTSDKSDTTATADKTNKSDKTASATTDVTAGNTNEDTGSKSAASSGDNTSDQNKAADNNSSGENTTVTSADEFMGGLLSENSKVDGESTTQNTGTDLTNSPIIKDTGFNFNTTVIMAAALGVLMLAGIIVTIKTDYFAQSDE